MAEAARPCCGMSRGGATLAPVAPIMGAGPRGAVIRVPGGRSFVGTDRPVIAQDGEGPARAVQLRDYGLEAETVTNARFSAFVAATGYVTEAERFGWSAVFLGDPADPRHAQSLGASLPWWHRIDGANWRQPVGPGSDLDGREAHPVVQVSWADARAFADWTGGRLPTEAEWEHAARSGPADRRFPWGDAEPDDDTIHCNIWQGRFPHHNTCRDGWERTAPARSFAPNPLGFYNMVGNVWEWTAEPFRLRSLSATARARNAQARRHDEKLLKGGSFLCHITYCYRYRIAARMALSPDSAASNAGFRVAYDL